jgi:hypothetical protein
VQRTAAGTYLVYCGIDPYTGLSGCVPFPAGSQVQNIVVGSVDAVPCVSSPSVVDSLATAQGIAFPMYSYMTPQEALPYEFAVTLMCGSSVDSLQLYNFNDSYGIYFPPPPAQLDSCASKVSVGASVVGALHTHPFFHNLTELNANGGCTNSTNPGLVPSTNPGDVLATNQANYDFSVNDRNVIAYTSALTPISSEGKSFYLRVPTGLVIIRTETSSQNGQNTQVYP